VAVGSCWWEYCQRHHICTKFDVYVSNLDDRSLGSTRSGLPHPPSRLGKQSVPTAPIHGCDRWLIGRICGYSRIPLHIHARPPIVMTCRRTHPHPIHLQQLCGYLRHLTQGGWGGGDGTGMRGARPIYIRSWRFGGPRGLGSGMYVDVWVVCMVL
jgi:hypothetical protein